MPSRLPSLTSLRWFAALGVFVSHLNHIFSGTSAMDVLTRVGIGAGRGVSFFFILSGFVLAWSHRPGDHALGFYRRRFARVVPAYWAACLLAVPVLAFAAPTDAWGTAERLIPLTLLQSWVPSERVYFSGAAVGWSLSTEVVFYALFPLLIVLLGGLSRRGAAAVGAAAVAAVIVIAMMADGDGVVTARENWLVAIVPPVRMLEFVFGMTLGLVLRDGGRLRIRPLTAMAVAVASGLAIGWLSGAKTEVAITIVPFGLVIFTCAQADADGRAVAWLHQRWLLILGQWSYAFYLMHILAVLVVARVFVGMDPSVPVRIVLAGLALGLGVGLAGALFRYVEYPLERRIRGGGSATPRSELETHERSPARARP